jgi:predicted Zn-dependent protease
MRRSRLLVAVVIAAGALLSYYGSREVNPVTGETQHIAISKEQEVALGLRSAPEMAEQFGGLEQDAEMQDDVERSARTSSRRAARRRPATSSASAC